MKFSWGLLLLLVLGLSIPRASHAQVAVYGEGSAILLDNHVNESDWLEGGALGITYDGPTVMKHFTLSADIRTGYTEMSSNGERFLSALVGPRLTFPYKKWKISPYGEFVVGFARYRNVSTSTATVTSLSTTDSQWGAVGGVARQLTSRLDVVGEYSFTEYGVNDGEFNPQTVSAGVVYHFTKR